MISMQKVSLLLVCTLFIAVAVDNHHHEEYNLCPSVIFGFTDSLNDCGNFCDEISGLLCAASFWPYGINLPQGATGRWSNGKLMIDLLAEHLNVSSLETASRKYDGSSFAGLNFGYAGATAQDIGVTVHTFAHQVADFLTYKENMVEHHNQDNQEFVHDFFSRALHFVQVGGNDVNFQTGADNENITAKTIPAAVYALQDGIHTLYDNGARNFLVFSVPAAGCMTIFLKNFENFGFQYDNMGCMIEINQMAKELSNNISAMVDRLRMTLPKGKFVYYDLYEAQMEVLNNPTEFGFHVDNLLLPCCGQGDNKYNCYGGKKFVCGCNSTATPCENADDYVIWDGIHFTQKFYKKMLSNIVSGNHVHPPYTKFSTGCAGHH